MQYLLNCIKFIMDDFSPKEHSNSLISWSKSEKNDLNFGYGYRKWINKMSQEKFIVQCILVYYLESVSTTHTSNTSNE